MSIYRLKGRPIFRGFSETDKRWATIVAHRRCGKTVACVQKLVREAFNCKRGQGRYAYIAPLYGQAKDVAWQYLAGYGRKIDATVLEYELRIDLPHNGARVRLYGADNPDRLRGIYLDGAVLDEYADMRPSVWGDVVRPMLTDRQGWATFIGTPKGHNAFYDKWQEATADPANWFSVMLKASETGILSPEELADARRTMSEDQYLQEFECSFEAAIHGAYFATQMKLIREQNRIGLVPLDPSRLVNTFWDIGKSDQTSIWFHQSHGAMHHLIDYYENAGEGVEHYARYLDEIAKRRSWKYGKHYGPHDLDNSHWILPGADTTVDVARRLGINFEVVPRISNKNHAIEAARNFLGLTWIDQKHCEQGIEALDHYRKGWDEVRKTWLSKPEHDWSSHCADALMTGACGFTPDYVAPTEDRYAKPRSRSSAWAA